MHSRISSIVGTLIISCAAVLASAHDSWSDTIYVASNGDDAAPGTAQAPLRTVQAGLQKAGPGDTVFVKQGLYRGRLTFPRDGAAGEPITLEGESGTILDGGTLVTGWKRVAGGGNVYRVAYTGPQPYNMTWNNKYICRIRDDLMATDGMTILRTGPNTGVPWGDPTYHGWDGVQAIWGTLNGYLYVGFGDPAIDAAKQQITTAPSIEDGGAVITIDGRKFITVRGLTIRNGYYGVVVYNKSSDCIIENNTIIGGYDNVYLWKGPSRIVVRKNEMTLGYVQGLAPDQPRHWFIWAVFKIISDADRGCVEVENVGSDNEVAENHLYENFDGVENMGAGVRLTVRDNLIERMADDALEPDGEETDARWHDNIVRESNKGLRHKGIFGPGPMYFYRNVISTKPPTRHGDEQGIYFFSGTTTRSYIYHNTFATALGVEMGSTNREVGMGNAWVVNNIFSCAQVYDDDRLWKIKPHFAYNYCGGDLSAPLAWWGQTNKVVANGQLWKNAAAEREFQLSPTSPARELGIDLSKPWTLDGVQHPALPGMEAGYFMGTRPDAGARQYYPPTGETGLTMAVSPSGAGTTVPTNGKTAIVLLGQPVIITATAAGGFVFDHWSGTAGATFSDPSSWRTSTTLSANATVTANFVQSQPGTVWDWGLNSNGQIGDGTIITRTTPSMVVGLPNIIQSLPPPPLVGGQYHTLALSSAGTVYAWGANGYGQLGIGTLTENHTPVSVSALSNIVWIAAGSGHSAAVDNTGAVWMWGNNAAGQLGDGTKVNRKSPVKVSGLTGVTVLQVAAGNSHTLALDSTGQVWAWGGNTRGQLGNGTTLYSLTPIKVPGLTNATAIAAGMYHSLALDKTGGIWAWGANESGQLGIATHTDSWSPVSVAGLPEVTQVAAGGWHSLAIDSGGSVWTWGANWYGQLGDGTQANEALPVQAQQIGSLTFSNAVQVAGGADHSVVLDSTGTVWMMGWNKQGQLGDGTFTDHWYAQPVPLFPITVGCIGAGGWDTLSVVKDPHAAGLARSAGSLSGLANSNAVPSAAPAAGAALSAAAPSVPATPATTAPTTAEPAQSGSGAAWVFGAPQGTPASAPSAPGLTKPGVSIPCDGIVDDRDHSEAKQFTVLSGAWSSALLDSAYAGSYTYTAATTGAQTARVRFSCTALNAGKYDVYAWWPAKSDGATHVAYEVHHTAGGTTVRVNQSARGGQWNLLGTFDFEAGSHVVDVHNGASGPGAVVCADAVRFVPAGTDITR